MQLVEPSRPRPPTPLRHPTTWLLLALMVTLPAMIAPALAGADRSGPSEPLTAALVATLVGGCINTVPKEVALRRIVRAQLQVRWDTPA